jgi:hypothetical protein
MYHELRTRGRAVTLTEFLLARITETEADFRDKFDTAPPEPDAPDWLRWGLAECEAKRRIVESCQRLEEQSLDGAWWLVEQDSILSALALPHADHPDFREEWKP